MEGHVSHPNQKPELSFTEKDWERVERDTMAWWAGELDRPLVGLTAYGAVPTWPRYQYFSNYPLDMPVDEIVDLYEPVFAAARFYGDAFPAWWVNFGPGIMAGFLGGKVNSVSDPSETVWFSPRQEISIEDLDPVYDPENVWWKRVKDLTTAIIERWEGRVAVGHTDLGGNLDILASFRETQTLLFDLMDQPQKVERLAGRITELWLRYYDELDKLIRPACRGTTCWTPIWSTGKTYMLQCDFSYMISPAMFERFVLPDLAACCDYLDHGFYHLDGKGQIPHLDLLLSIGRLRGIQWIPGDGQPPPHEWLPLLKRIRDGGKLCQVSVSPEGARTIVKNLGGKGFLLVVFGGRQFADPEVAEAFLKTLAQEDISLSG
jgi:5-methyltetrahydrofolate--homocysteine methyltransferase